MTRRLYLAYGSNLNKAQMRRRCPQAKPIKVIWLDDAKLVFRGVADLQHEQGATTPCGLWEISASDEAALDRYEGVSAGLYEKKMVPLDNGKEALVYLMTSDGIAPPSREYYTTIKHGYYDFGIDVAPLEAALKHSHTHERHTSATRQRRARAIQRGQFVVQRPSRDAMVRDVEQVASDLEQAPRDTAKLLPATSRTAIGNGTSSASVKVGRPLDDGYNWSAAARKGSKSKQRRVYTQQEIQEIAEHARKNHKPHRHQKRKNLADWLADKNNRY